MYTAYAKKKMFSYVTNKKYHTHRTHKRKSLLTNTVTTNKTKKHIRCGAHMIKKRPLASKGLLMQFVAL